MGVNQKSAKYRGQNFIRVLLLSGTRANPLGDEELAVFCQCNSEEPVIEDVDTKGLIAWVNSNEGCKRNQSNQRYILSRDVDAMAVIFLTEREIQCCKSANRIYPCLV